MPTILTQNPIKKCFNCIQIIAEKLGIQPIYPQVYQESIIQRVESEREWYTSLQLGTMRMAGKCKILVSTRP